MTEAEWLAADDPQPLLASERGNISDRKLQLFACACCRRLIGLFPNAVMRHAIEVGELDADQLASGEDLTRLEAEVASWLNSRHTQHSFNENTHAELSALRTAQSLTRRDPMDRATLAKYTSRDAANAVHIAANDRRAIREAPATEMIKVARATWQAAQKAYAAELRAQAALLRDIVGNPFRQATFDEGWQRPEVVIFADIIYEKYEFGRMVELGDLLADIGCTEPAILAHCRGMDEHVRGCWVLDKLLGKS